MWEFINIILNLKKFNCIFYGCFHFLNISLSSDFNVDCMLLFPSSDSSHNQQHRDTNDHGGQAVKGCSFDFAVLSADQSESISLTATLCSDRADGQPRIAAYITRPSPDPPIPRMSIKHLGFV